MKMFEVNGNARGSDGAATPIVRLVPVARGK
jgi:hypothetical protein